MPFQLASNSAEDIAFTQQVARDLGPYRVHRNGALYYHVDWPNGVHTADDWQVTYWWATAPEGELWLLMNLPPTAVEVPLSALPPLP